MANLKGSLLLGIKNNLVAKPISGIGVSPQFASSYRFLAVILVPGLVFHSHFQILFQKKLVFSRVLDGASPIMRRVCGQARLNWLILNVSRCENSEVAYSSLSNPGTMEPRRSVLPLLSLFGALSFVGFLVLWRCP